MNSESGGERNSMEIASPSQENDQSKNFRTLTLLYSNYFWSRFSNSPFIGKLSSFCRQFGRARSRRQKLCLPLPLPSKSVHSSLILTEASRIYDVLEDVFEHILSNMHNVQKNLQYWQAKAEGSNAQKAYFMMFERGPRALIGETVEFVRNFISEDSSFQTLCHSASGFISDRVSVLDSIRCALAVFLSQVYMAIDKQGEDLVADPQKALPPLLITINGLFSNLENSIAQLHNSLSQIDSFAGENNSYELVFNRMTEVQSQWTDDEIRGAINIIYQNLQKLDSYLSLIIARHRKPRKMTRYWIWYTCGAVGLSVCSLWIVRHSRLVGSPDIDDWICEAKESTITFWTEHVEQPLMSIRDELFETFRKRHRGVMDSEEVQLTANSLHRMLVAFCEQANGQNFPKNATDLELLQIVMERYEKEMVHPLKSAFGGELPRAMLIQVQKLKLDIETAMLELNQILKANEINFAILAALPAFALFLLSIMLVRSWVTQDKGAEGRGRLARRQRRLLIVEIEKKIMRYQSCMELGQAQDGQYSFGLVLYTLDRLYRAVERHAKMTGEWSCLRQDIIDLAKPDLQTTHKLTITSRMERVYECLLPSLK
ncbi:protein DGS1, mitochondrial-like [Chenopodium quinoa]|uniref:protein DGS1, mitochondrial-like n=1 Tax=Chenopodium quinoa TaxID=63459 RepID=UPI000B7804C0|nr:protein DGS1, mitochondrial-like [Chenopodium quinoa]